MIALADVGCSRRGEGCLALKSLPVTFGIEVVLCKDPWWGFVTPSTTISPVVVVNWFWLDFRYRLGDLLLNRRWKKLPPCLSWLFLVVVWVRKERWNYNEIWNKWMHLIKIILICSELLGRHVIFTLIPPTTSFLLGLPKLLLPPKYFPSPWVSNSFALVKVSTWNSMSSASLVP